MEDNVTLHFRHLLFLSRSQSLLLSIQLCYSYLRKSSLRFYLIVHHPGSFRPAQHKVVCIQLLKVLCRRPVLLFFRLMPDKSVRSTSAHLLRRPKRSSISCIASSPFLFVWYWFKTHTLAVWFVADFEVIFYQCTMNFNKWENLETGTAPAINYTGCCAPLFVKLDLTIK
jgi:hypothetical protein